MYKIIRKNAKGEEEEEEEFENILDMNIPEDEDEGDCDDDNYDENYDFTYKFFHNGKEISKEKILERKEQWLKVTSAIAEMNIVPSNTLLIRKIEKNKKINSVKTRKIIEKIISVKNQHSKSSMYCALLHRINSNLGLFIMIEKYYQSKVFISEIKTNRNNKEYVEYSYYSQGVSFNELL